MIDFEEPQSLRENYEQRKREEQERKDAVKKEYLRAVATCENKADNSAVHTAQVLREAVYKKEYDTVLKILDKVRLPKGYTFGIRVCKMGGGGLGDESKPYVQKLFGKRSEPIFEFLYFEDSPMGAWQAYLLHQMWHYLPLWWHSNYARRHYHYSSEDAPVFRDPLPYFGEKVVKIFPDFSRFDLSPEIYTMEGKYYISSCFWTSFGGLIREYVVLTMNEERMEDFCVFDEETLVEYNCGIVF